jgi:GTP-binding protein EngB required for normal cell division
MQLLEWYERHAGPFLKKSLAPERVAGFDKEYARLVKAVRVRLEEVAVCFLGPSGIGKSTLINAVVGGSQAVVPSGGVGPLTAQAIVVRGGARRGLEVEYHGANRILQTIFGLEMMYKAELGTPADPDKKVDDDLAGVVELEEDELPVEEGAEAPAEGEGAEAGTASVMQRKARREQYRRSAHLLVTGSQDGDRDLRYLIDSLREASGGKRLWGTEPDPADAERMTRLRRALALAKEGRKFVLPPSASDEEFHRSLHEHASGYLAPLIKGLTLDWPGAKLPEGLTLVDLPGVGVVRDVHAEVTRRWVRERAKALVLVVDHRGLTEPLAEALRRSEFLNSLLYSADEPEDDPILMVAVTRIDDVAGERFRQDRSKKRYEHFGALVEEARERLKGELHARLEEIWLSEEGAGELRRQVARNLLASLQVHPLSAPEYAKLIADDEDDPPFLKQLEQTGIPTFVRSLDSLVAERRDKALGRLRDISSVFLEQVVTSLRLIEAQWEGVGRAEEEAARLREELEVFIRPLREELANRQGWYRAFLKRNIPQRIEDLVETAKAKASMDIDRYLARLWQSHWGTLKASVIRGGRYSGASEINLPTEFALRFEEPIAEVWGKEILKDIRKETKAYADDCVSLVEQVAEWALAQGARVQPRVVEAQRDAIRADARKLQSVGQEMIKEMRDEVKAQLVGEIEGPIKAKCSAFVRKNSHVGPGVKARILELYSDLADEVTAAAEVPAKRILLRLFKEVEKEILDALAERQNPLESIFEAIVVSQQKYLERSDAQKRRRVLAELHEVLTGMPAQAEAMAETQSGGENVV